LPPGLRRILKLEMSSLVRVVFEKCDGHVRGRVNAVV